MTILYAALDEERSKIGQGVAGNPDFGDDSPLYGAMGFVRKSERKSASPRKRKSLSFSLSTKNAVDNTGIGVISSMLLFIST